MDGNANDQKWMRWRVNYEIWHLLCREPLCARRLKADGKRQSSVLPKLNYLRIPSLCITSL